MARHEAIRWAAGEGPIGELAAVSILLRRQDGSRAGHSYLKETLERERIRPAASTPRPSTMSTIPP